MSEDTVFQIGERMFGGGSSQPHRIRSGPLLHTASKPGGFPNLACSIPIPSNASPPVIHDKSRMR